MAGADLGWDEIARRAHQLLDAMGVADARQLTPAQSHALARLATLDERTVGDAATLLARRPGRRLGIQPEHQRRPA